MRPTTRPEPPQPRHPPRYVVGWVAGYLGATMARNAASLAVSIARVLAFCATAGISEIALHTYRRARVDWRQAHHP